MKYGESCFDILYLLFAILIGCLILKKARSRTESSMGAAALILGLGDAFHLVPRVLHYFSAADLTAALGVGKLITSVTMTVFYVLLYDIWQGYYRVSENKRRRLAVWGLGLLRIVLCLFPQNGWLQNEGNMTWGLIRNIPFVALGALIIVLFFQKRREPGRFAPIWIYILLSFLFYIPVAVGAGAVPILGMLMLPKTICYILIILVFWQSVTKEECLAGSADEPPTGSAD